MKKRITYIWFVIFLNIATYCSICTNGQIN